jgi:hypothetical protein
LQTIRLRVAQPLGGAAFGRRSFWAAQLLGAQLLGGAAFGRRSFWAAQLLGGAAFGRRSFWVAQPLGGAAFGWRSASALRCTAQKISGFSRCGTQARARSLGDNL